MDINKRWNDFIERHRDETQKYLGKRYSTLAGEDIENVFQDSLIVLHNNIEQGKVSDLLYPYFLKICINLSLKKVGEQSRHSIFSINETDIKQKNSVSQKSVEQVLKVCHEQDEIESEVSERKAKLVHSILNSMTPQCKQLLWKFYAEDLNWATIAGLTGLSNANSAKSSANRCRQTFKEKFIHLKTRIYG